MSNGKSQFDESTFPQRMLTAVSNDLTLDRDQFAMRSPFYTRRLLFVSFNSKRAPSCSDCNSRLYLRTESGYINGSITIGTCEKCNGKEYQIVLLTADGKINN
jgi:hypothetical protein